MNRSLIYLTVLFTGILTPLPAAAQYDIWHDLSLFRDQNQRHYAELNLSIGLVQGPQNTKVDSFSIEWFLYSRDSVFALDKVKLRAMGSDASIKNARVLFDSRMSIKPDIPYELKVQVQALGTELPPHSIQKKFKAESEQIIHFSHIQFLESFSGGSGRFLAMGLNYRPYPLALLAPPMDTMTFYTELYGIPASMTTYALRYCLTQSNGDPLPGMCKTVRLERKDPQVVFSRFPLQGLGNGTYLLVVEAISPENQVLAKVEKEWYRAGAPEAPPPDLNTLDHFARHIPPDSLNLYLKYLNPIANPREAEQIEILIGLIPDTTHARAHFFYNFWRARDYQSPQIAWQAYHAEVIKANRMFTCAFEQGYEGARGRVYLKYGAPNSVKGTETDPLAYPYQIWHYYNLDNQTNRKFVFYYTDQVSGCYELLHSNAVGEVYNARWEAVLMGRRGAPSQVGETVEPTHTGNRIREDWNP